MHNDSSHILSDPEDRAGGGGVAASGPRALFRDAQRQPMLSREEEVKLAHLAVQGDQAAADRLVASHLRFVIKIARGYRNYGLPMTDLVQEGMVGLLQAAGRFNPDRDVRFATYAMWWIRAAIQDHVVRSWSLVRVGTTAAQKSLFFNLRRKMAELKEGADALSEEILAPLAKRFGLTLKDARALAWRTAGRDQSLDRAATGEGGESWLDRLIDPRPSVEDKLAEDSERTFWSGLLTRAIDRLPPREQHIVRHRFLAEVKETREALGRQLGISKERVRQLEAAALGKLRTILLPARGGA